MEAIPATAGPQNGVRMVNEAFGTAPEPRKPVRVPWRPCGQRKTLVLNILAGLCRMVAPTVPFRVWPRRSRAILALLAGLWWLLVWRMRRVVVKAMGDFLKRRRGRPATGPTETPPAPTPIK